MSYCGSEMGESEIYSPYSFCGSEAGNDVAYEDPQFGWNTGSVSNIIGRLEDCLSNCGRCHVNSIFSLLIAVDQDTEHAKDDKSAAYKEGPQCGAQKPGG